MTSAYNLNYPRSESLDPLAFLDISLESYMYCKIVVPFKNRLYACSNYPGEECYSYNFYTGVNDTHPPLNSDTEEHCGFSLAEVNGKIWITGGKNKYRKTAFLHANFTWVEGPDLPAPKYYHITVAISETKVVILGGYNSADIWIYDDSKGTYETRRYYDIGMDLNACKLTGFKEIGHDVILVRGYYGEMYIFDWEIDVWFKLDSTWTVPSEYFYNTYMFQLDQR